MSQSHIEKGRVVAVIPARGGSKGIPRKNLRAVGGISLIARSIRAAQASPEVDLVVVSSDDAEILAVAEAEGARGLRRPDALSGDTASSESALLHVLDTLESEGDSFDTLIFIQCTSPFTSGEDVSAVVASFDDPQVSSALTVSENHGFLWKKDPTSGFASGINHDESKPRARRQDMEPEYRENGAVYGMRVPAFRDAGQRFIPPVALVETYFPINEIDEPSDIDIIEAIFAQQADHTASVDVADLLSVRFLITDFDGVHTNDCVDLDETGRESVRCSRRDGMGVSLLREQTDIHMLILSKETNPVVTRRAEKLKVDVIQGVGAKRDVLQAWLSERDSHFGEVAFIGNDINDLACLQAAKIGFVPSDAHESVKLPGIFEIPQLGGEGAIRDVCDMLIAARAK